MDALQEFFAQLNRKSLTKGRFLGFIHVLIACRIAQKDGTLLSKGMGWRELAGLLKKVRWDPEDVRELGIDPDELPPRDRVRFWFTAISRAGVDSRAAADAGKRFAEVLRKEGYEVGTPPARPAAPAKTD